MSESALADHSFAQSASWRRARPIFSGEVRGFVMGFWGRRVSVGGEDIS